MKNSGSYRKGFTLMETVIAIGVLAVLLTGFLAVFTPAAQGIQRSIDTQQADRLASTLERELVTYREGSDNLGSGIPSSSTTPTGFDKAFDWMLNGNNADQAIIVYQYRGSTSDMRADGTPQPHISIEGEPGETYTVQTIARRLDILLQPEYVNDIKASEGRMFFVKPQQLVFENGELMPTDDTDELQFLDPDGNLVSVTNPNDYLDAVISFSAAFHTIPGKNETYLRNQFSTLFDNANNPVFTRNLSVRR